MVGDYGFSGGGAVTNFRIVWTRKQTPAERARLMSGRMCEVETIACENNDQAVAYGMAKAAERGWTFITTVADVKVEVIDAV